MQNHYDNLPYVRIRDIFMHEPVFTQRPVETNTGVDPGGIKNERNGMGSLRL